MKHNKNFLFGLVLFTSMFLLNLQPAFAADRSAAVSYADSYAMNPNSAFPLFTDNDCTNFVSQAMRAGGIPQNLYSAPDGVYNTSDDHYWYMRETYPGDPHSYSWSSAVHLWNYLMIYSGKGHVVKTNAGNIGDHQYNPLSKGDLVAYNWGEGINPGKANHWGMEVGIGTDIYGWTGDLVDTHSANHYHEYWTLQPTNVKHLNTTTVYSVSISY